MKYHKHNKGIKLLGLRLKNLRKQKAVSQEQLANLCDFEISQISRIERGIINTSISSIFTIAEKLEISPKELFDFEEIQE